MKMKKILFVILLCGVMALGLAGCSNLVSDSKKELEDAKNDLEETYKKYGWVEKETVNTILAKFNTEIMDGGLNTPASDDYMVVFIHKNQNEQLDITLKRGVYPQKKIDYKMIIDKAKSYLL